MFMCVVVGVFVFVCCRLRAFCGNSDYLYSKGCSFFQDSDPPEGAGHSQEGLVITKTEVFLKIPTTYTEKDVHC